jgi:DNA-binding MarR family transcriptional regulator
MSSYSAAMPSNDRIVTLLVLVRRTARSMVDELVERMASHGYPEVTASWHAVFENLDRDGTRLTALADRARMTHQSMSELVSVIEAHGYLERVQDPSDRRVRLVRFTTDGRRLARVALRQMRAIEEKWTARLGEAGLDRPLAPILAAALARDSDTDDRA